MPKTPDLPEDNPLVLPDGRPAVPTGRQDSGGAEPADGQLSDDDGGRRGPYSRRTRRGEPLIRTWRGELLTRTTRRRLRRLDKLEGIFGVAVGALLILVLIAGVGFCTARFSGPSRAIDEGDAAAQASSPNADAPSEPVNATPVREGDGASTSAPPDAIEPSGDEDRVRRRVNDEGSVTYSVPIPVPEWARHEWLRRGGDTDPVGRRSPLTFVKRGEAVEPLLFPNAVAGLLIDCEQTPPTILALLDNTQALQIEGGNGRTADGMARLDSDEPQRIKWFRVMAVEESRRSSFSTVRTEDHGPEEAMAAQLTPASQYYVSTQNRRFWSRMRTALRPEWRPVTIDTFSTIVTFGGRRSSQSRQEPESSEPLEDVFVERSALTAARMLTVSAPTDAGDIYYRFSLADLEATQRQCRRS